MKAIIQQNGSTLPTDAIEGDTWILTDAETLSMLRKMESTGIPLKEYAKGEIYYGIKTGFNKAFVIDSIKRLELIAEDPASNDLIKPMVIGDDVRKWHIRDKDRWMIVTPIDVEINNYPAIFKHLKRWKEDLQKRQDQGNHWWELRACNYYDKIYSKKILIPAFAMTPRFSLDTSNSVVNAPCYFIASQDLFLLGILNSTLAFQFLQLMCTVLGDESARGRVVLRPIYFSQLPIPYTSDKDKKRIEDLVQKCLGAKGIGCEKWEKELDEIVIKLYGLKE